MAVVVWVFSGGGEAEVAGLIPFLQKNFPGCKFERKIPAIKKPGSKPNKANSYGNTGKSLIAEINKKLPLALQKQSGECDLILVFDDLDCREPEAQKIKILEAISKIPEANNINKYIGFAAPELEAWIIADWNNTIAKHRDFRGRHERMRWWLSTQKNIPFDQPESFSEYDAEKDCCKEKLSTALIESSELDENVERFYKSTHTPELLLDINCQEVQQKCPIFREMYNYLNNLCNTEVSS
ncbi:MAG TPA: DUF4276 family protein [Nostocaceae cyanobacterium]|nr:DUF4276 family protein [Nostocaceae cyanobacterium]